MESKQLRIVYMGTPDFAVMPLQRLVEEGYNIVGVVTTPDKPAGRGLKVQESAVKRYAASVGLPILQPEKLKAPDFVEAFRALNPDLAIVIAFRMLPEIIWAMPRLGTFNLHASLLPQYRGAAPINWAIINGEQETGVTTFLLNHEIDKGDILGQSRVQILPGDNVGSLHDKLMETGTDLVVRTVEKIAVGDTAPIPQPKTETTGLKGAPKIFKETCRIDWTQGCNEINNLIRGLSPYPAAWTELVRGESASILKIYTVEPEPSPHQEQPGTIRSDNKQIFKVACGDGYIRITELQLAGKKRMHADELLRGFKEIAAYYCQ